MKHVVCGLGEVGNAIASTVLMTGQELIKWDPLESLCDKVDNTTEECAALHICFPWNVDFIQYVEEYYEQFKPRLITIIHSTVPVGTTRSINIPHIVHSPTHGVHPNIVKGLHTFVKPVGAVKGSVLYHPSLANALYILDSLAIKAEGYTDSDTTEMSKLMCTLQYAWNIVLCKEIAAICKEYDVPFCEVYTMWNTRYNQGYTELGKTSVVRPKLSPMAGPIGGHCLIPNAKLIKTWLTDIVLARNEHYEGLQDGAGI